MFGYALFTCEIYTCFTCDYRHKRLSEMKMHCNTKYAKQRTGNIQIVQTHQSRTVKINSFPIEITADKISKFYWKL